MKKLTCGGCSKRFRGKKGQLFCSKRCAGRTYARRKYAVLYPKQPARQCAVCGKEFAPYQKTHRYCSQRCSAKAFYQRNREARLVKNRRLSDERHQRVAALLGGRCVACGITDWRVLQVNHINGGGRQEVHRVRRHIYQELLTGRRQTDDLDLRCANCNILYEYHRRPYPQISQSASVPAATPAR